MTVKSISVAAAIALVCAACSSPGPSTTPAAPAPAPAAGAPAAPATGAAGSTAGDTVIATEILVNVINKAIPPSQATVFVVGPSVGRMVLGDVPIGQEKAFTFKAGNLNGDYYLVAQGPGGRELRSRVFNLTPSLRFVQWQLDVNSIVQYATPK